MVGDGTDPNARTPLDYPPGVGHTRFNLLLWAVVLITALVALDDVLGAVR